jgi:hypothetical protein
LALTLAATACTNDALTTGSLVSGRGATIAFESIDGAPRPIFQKLVENLASEAVAHQVTVISREAAANYRVRGYMAAHLEARQIHIGWVWDVYDANRRRVLRIASEEPAGRRSGDAWNAADDAMLRRIARSGMDRLAAFLDAPGTTAPLPEAPGSGDGPAVAAADGTAERTGETSAQPVNETAAPVRSPPRKPQRAEAPGLAAALALADTRH